MRLLLVVLALLLTPAVTMAPAAAADVLDVPLPPGSRSQGAHLFSSGRGFRATVDFYTRFLQRRGIAHEAIPVYRYRGTAVARFLSRQPGTQWDAIHVFHDEGRTRIFLVQRAPASTFACTKVRAISRTCGHCTRDTKNPG